MWYGGNGKRLPTGSVLRATFTESQNHRIVGVGRDLCGSSSPTLLPKQGHLQQAFSYSAYMKSKMHMVLISELLQVRSKINLETVRD